VEALRRVLAVALLAAVPVLGTATPAGVRAFLEVIERYETGGNCTARPPVGSAIGCYQMTRGALQDVGLKDGAGNWLANPWNITSDAEFQRNRAANDYAVKQYTRLTWGRLSCRTKRAACGAGQSYGLDPPSLLSGTHFLGAGGMNAFVGCGMKAECLADDVVRANGGDRAAIHQRLLQRMDDAAGFDISELTPWNRTKCGVQQPCGTSSDAESPEPPAIPEPPVTPPPPPPPPQPPPIRYDLLAGWVIGGGAVLGATALLVFHRLRGARTSGGRGPGQQTAAGPSRQPFTPAAPPVRYALPGPVLGKLHSPGGSPPVPLSYPLLSSRHGLIIGRDAELSDVQIPDSTVSRRHLRLRVGGGEILAEDLNSLAGTRVDGIPLTPFDARPITAGQTLHIAGHAYELLLQDGGTGGIRG